MKPPANEKGVAVVTALLLTLVSLGIVMALLFMLSAHTQISGAHKRYKNSLEASYGAVQLLSRDLIPAMVGSVDDLQAKLTTDFASVGLETSSNDCLRQKISTPSSSWSACGPNSTTSDPRQDYDVSLKLLGTSGPGYRVYAKITDTVPGNTDTAGYLLDSASGVTGGGSGITPPHIPTLYQIETEGESIANGREKASLSVLYAY